jgi:hypothetical protein
VAPRCDTRPSLNLVRRSIHHPFRGILGRLRPSKKISDQSLEFLMACARARESTGGSTGSSPRGTVRRMSLQQRIASLAARFRFLSNAAGRPVGTFNPKAAGSNPARPIKSEETRESSRKPTQNIREVAKPAPHHESQGHEIGLRDALALSQREEAKPQVRTTRGGQRRVNTRRAAGAPAVPSRRTRDRSPNWSRSSMTTASQARSSARVPNTRPPRRA